MVLWKCGRANGLGKHTLSLSYIRDPFDSGAHAFKVVCFSQPCSAAGRSRAIRVEFNQDWGFASLIQ